MMARLRSSQARPAIVFGAVGLVILLLPLRDFIDALTLPNLDGYGGVDYRLYMDATMRWLHGGSYFEAYQLAGPYQISAGDILYPPLTLLLFLPFTVLPAILWWLLPAAAVAYSLARLRPGPIVWPYLALCLAWPPTLVKIVTGNPVIWAVAALSLGILYAWPSILVLIKPSLFPFAFFGANRRSWWVALGAIVILSVPFGFLWIDWIHSILNSQGGGIAYSIQEVPMLAFPLIAWAGRRRTVPRGVPQPIDSPG
jgi:hypothetical protein